ncbi:histone deacetylase family protein [Roseimaritima ulvae]|nr:histone deacetylase [Roseimaritima ulvae]
MTLFYYDTIFQEHKTGEHPENGGRLLPAIRHLHFIGLDSDCKRPSWEPATVEQLQYVHALQYIQSVERFAADGGGLIEADTILSERSYEVARWAAGAACNAVQRVVTGEDKTALCLGRPPGHHAMPDHPMGFCLFNSIAVAARVATNELGLQRVLIVDFDVHHGNGTQAMFYDAADVAYLSMHRAELYPGTGTAEEQGSGKGLGTTLNLPVEMGTPREQQLDRFQSQLRAFAAHIQPQLVLVSAGFDAHKNDPVGSLGWENEDYRVATRCLLDVAAEHAEGKLVSVLEGGYNPTVLSDCIAIHLEELLAVE